MNQIEGVDLARCLAEARQAAGKITTARLTEWLRWKLVEAHNMEVQAAALESRIQSEVKTKREKAAAIRELITRVQSGDWTAVEPLELPTPADKAKDSVEKQ